MDEIDPAALKSSIFDYLSGMEEPKAVKMKDIKVFLQGHFKNSFKEGSLRQMLETFAAQFFMQMDERGFGARKMGKFSNAESSTISTALEAYANEEGIQLRNLCSIFRFDEAAEDDTHRAKTKSKIHAELWNRLQLLLPQRNRKAIIHHATRLIWNMELVDNHFTPEEEQLLLQLVQQHGRRFSIIAAKMKKRPDDCRQVLIRLNRQQHGYFSVGEDRALIAAVYELTHRNPAASPLPTKNIPWTGVANKLNNGRIPLDLLRRWKMILKLNESFGYPDNIDLPVDEEANVESVAIRMKRKNFEELNKLRVRLLLFLQDRGYEDESELVWAQVERTLHFKDGDAWITWKKMVKQVPDDEELIGSMQDQVVYLLEMYRTLLNLTDEELAELEPPPAEVFQDDPVEPIVAIEDEGGGGSNENSNANNSNNQTSTLTGKKRKKRQ